METSRAQRKLVTHLQLAHRSASIQERSGRLVLTNGCFDLLHVGHTRYLQEARQLGDALAVGVNSDDSVRRLKGPGRPIMPQSERAELLAALACVDFVTIFDSDTAVGLVELVKPKIYVKGGDYSGDPQDARFPIEGRSVRTYGGEVVILPYVAGRSTSRTLQDFCAALRTEP